MANMAGELVRFSTDSGFGTMAGLRCPLDHSLDYLGVFYRPEEAGEASLW